MSITVTREPPRDAGLVIHGDITQSAHLVQSFCSYERDRCGPPSWTVRHCPTCSCRLPSDRAPGNHGTYVRCWCGRDGVVPDRDHILDFLPKGSTIEQGNAERPDVLIIHLGNG